MSLSIEFTRTRAILSECEAYLSKLQEDPGAIKAYLTQYLRMVLYAEIDNTLNSILEHKSNTISQAKYAHYLKAAFSKNHQGLTKAKFTEYAKLFGDEVSRAFSRKLEGVDKEQMITVYGNAILERNRLAHAVADQVSTITMDELKRSVEAAEMLLRAFSESIDDCA